MKTLFALNLAYNFVDYTFLKIYARFFTYLPKMFGLLQVCKKIFYYYIFTKYDPYWNDAWVNILLDQNLATCLCFIQVEKVSI